MMNYMLARTTVTNAGLLLLAFWLSGCASNQSKYGQAYREWSSRMSEMGIFPVYPPREDIVVGDVYALPLHPYDRSAIGYIGGLGTAGIHVGYLGDPRMGWTNLSSGLFADYYGSRPYPADVTNAFADGTNSLSVIGIASYPDAGSRTNAFGLGSTARMRQVAFPDFSATTIDQGSLSAVVPIEGIMSAFNLNRSDITAVHFKIPQAESYGLTTEELLREVYESNQFRRDGNGAIYLRGNIPLVTNVVRSTNVTVNITETAATNLICITNVTFTVGGNVTTNVIFSVIGAAITNVIVTTNIFMDYPNSSILSVQGAQMASTMFAGIMNTFRNDPTTRIPWYHFAILSHLNSSLNAMKGHIYLALISEVYYARAIDITIDRKAATGASFAARPITADELKKLEGLGLTKSSTTTMTSTNNTAAGTGTTSSSGTNVVIGSTTQLIDLSPGDDAFQLAAKMRGLDVPSGVDNIGGTVKVLRVSASNIGLRRTFQRPIAVGVRGVLIRVNLMELKDFQDDNLGPTWMKVDLAQ